MEIDFEVEVKHRWIHERPYKVTLTRGVKGDYRWEIEVRGEGVIETIKSVKLLDNQLRKDYSALEPTEEEE